MTGSVPGELAIRNPTDGVCHSELNLMLLTEIPKGRVYKCTRYIIFFQVLRIPKVAGDSIVQSKTVSIKIFSPGVGCVLYGCLVASR